MRIAIFHNLPSGGGKRALFEWTRRLVDRHVIDVYSLETADQAFCDIRPFASQHFVFEFQPRRRFNPPFGRLDQYQRWRDLGDLRRLNQQIARQINAGHYDVIFANPCMYTFIPALLEYTNVPSAYYLHEPFGGKAARQFERPYIPKGGWRQSVNGWDPLIKLYESRLSSIQRQSLRKTIMLIANSQFTRGLIRSEFAVDPVFSPIGVDHEGFHPIAGRERQNYVVSVGEMSPRKGFDFLVKSLGEIPANKRPALKLACNMAKRQELAYIKELAEQKGVDLEILMNLNVDELRVLYNRARMCVYSPVKEPFGLVPLEAMACGTPVVGVREGGVPESVVHECTGLLAARNTKDFAAAIQLLLDDPLLAETYGRNGREHVVRNWTWEKSVTALETQLSRCAGAAA